MTRILFLAAIAISWGIITSEPMPPMPDNPPVSARSCPPKPPVPPPTYDPEAYLLAAQSQFTSKQLEVIARDDIAALRYLLAAVQTPGVDVPLPLDETRPLLHVLNTLATWPDAKNLPLAFLAHLRMHYGMQVANALILAYGPDDQIHGMQVADDRVPRRNQEKSAP